MDIETQIRKDVKAVKGKNKANAAAAERRLANRGAKATKHLILLAGSKNRILRYRAAWSLGLSGNSAAVPILNELSSDRDGAVSYDAMAALSLIKGKAAARALFKMLCHLPPSRSYGADLSRQGTHSKYFLFRLMNSSDEEVRRRAIYMAAANRHTRKALLRLSKSETSEMKLLIEDALNG